MNYAMRRGKSDSPATVGRLRADFGVTIRQVPHVALDLKRAGPVAPLRDVPADALGEVVVQEEADAPGCLQSRFGIPAMTRAHATHQARADDEEKRGRGDEEPVERGGGTGAVDE